MFSDVGSKRASEVKAEDIQEFALQILEAGFNNEETIFKISELGRIIRNAADQAPELLDGLTPLALQIAAEDMGGEAIGSILNKAPEKLNKHATLLFARQTVQLNLSHNSNELAARALTLGDCVKARPDLAEKMTVYALNLAASGQYNLLRKTMEANPNGLSIEAIRQFAEDISQLPNDDARKHHGEKAISQIFDSIPDLQSQLGTYQL